VIERLGRGLFFSEVSTNTTYNTYQRFDGIKIPIGYSNKSVTGYEVKVIRNDFLGDNKWPGYLPHCHDLGNRDQQAITAMQLVEQIVGEALRKVEA
jgi:hypothetical protein